MYRYGHLRPAKKASYTFSFRQHRKHQRSSTRRSVENHETTIVWVTPSRARRLPTPRLLALLARHRRRQLGGIPPHNGRAGISCSCGTPAQPHGDLGPKTSCTSSYNQRVRRWKKQPNRRARSPALNPAANLESGIPEGACFPAALEGLVSYGRSLTTGPRVRPSPGEGPHRTRGL